MSIDVIVAIVVSATSVVVSLVSLASSVIVNGRLTRSAEQVEILKHRLSQQTIREGFLDARLNESLKSLQAAIQAIQRVKDELQIILSAPEASIDTQSAVEYIGSARKELFACFENSMANLSEEETRILHKAKNRALSIETVVANGLKGSPSVSDMTDADRRLLWEYRSSLTDDQQLLRDSWSNRLLRRLGNA